MDREKLVDEIAIELFAKFEGCSRTNARDALGIGMELAHREPCEGWLCQLCVRERFHRMADAALAVAEAEFARQATPLLISLGWEQLGDALGSPDWYKPVDHWVAPDAFAAMADYAKRIPYLEVAIRKDEREACAKVALDDASETGKEPYPDSRTNEAILTARRIAAAIRARGEG